MTIAGYHTAHELADLLKAKDVNIADLAAAAQAFRGSSEATWVQWLIDFDAFELTWAQTHDYASTLVDVDTLHGLTAGDTVTEENAYQKVLSVLPPFDDLVRRWPRLPGAPATYAERPTPQPTAPDADLNVVNATTPIANLVDEVGAAIASPFTYPKTALVVAGVAVVGVLGVLSLLRRA